MDQPANALAMVNTFINGGLVMDAEITEWWAWQSFQIQINC